MITPDQIRQKAERLYPKFVKAWLDGDDFFPYILPSSKRRSGDITRDGEDIRNLRNGSKDVRGFGYTVEWGRHRTRDAGWNDLPERILFETQTDLLKLINKTTEFRAFAESARNIRHAFPQLENWIRSNIKAVTGMADIVDDLIRVTQWFQNNPRPDCFAREIPLPVHGKLVEENTGTLSQWFEVEGILPSDAIRSEETDFYRRYGLQDWKPLITLRCLDTATQELFRLPCAEASIPVDYFNSISLNSVRIFVVENMTNLRTFPAVPNSIVIFGMGNAAVELRELKGLQHNEVIYWGDLDVYGLRILSQYRRSVGRARSMFMDIRTCRQFDNLMLPPKKKYKPQKVPALLEPDEEEAFRVCNASQLQLEQERIPQQAVEELLNSLLSEISE